MSDTDTVLADLEKRVGERFAAAWQSLWPLPDDLMESWRSWRSDTVALEPAEQLPDDWPQFPPERWAILPAARARALMLAERCIDLGELGYAGWLLQYGGKVRLS